MAEIYEFTTAVRFTDVGPMGALRPTVLLDYLLDAAGTHAGRLGVGMEALRANGMTWFLSRLHVRVHRYPRGGEAMTVRTWPSGVQRLFFTREFVVFGAQAEVLALASSAWILVNLASRRLQKPGSLGISLPATAERPLPSTFPKLSAPGTVTVERHYRPLSNDIDINQHVNSTAYPRWTLDCVPSQLRTDSLPAEIEIAYIGETQYDDAVHGLTEACTPSETVHLLRRLADGTELLRQRTLWRPAAALVEPAAESVPAGDGSTAPPPVAPA